MTETEAIMKRHSVRSYQNKPIEAEKIVRLNELLSQVNAEGNLHLQLLEDAGRTFNRLMSKFMGLNSAPSVIACIGKDDETLDERIGYYGEKIVLAAQMMGLNTCWAGTFNREQVRAEIGKGERLAIVIAIGYGTTQGKERKSKTAAQVSRAQGDRPKWFDEGVELALKAPTAVNQQKFEIILHEDQSVSICDKGGIFSKIDLGIVKYHFEVAGKENKQ